MCKYRFVFAYRQFTLVTFLNSSKLEGEVDINNEVFWSCFD